MLESTPLDIPAPQIPDPWKVSWNRFETRTIDPILQFESMVCLTLPPDFVLDFGWYARDEGIRLID
jgi:hypothetical protein